nr:methyltransferase 22 isoform X1 [Bixa orellana]
MAWGFSLLLLSLPGLAGILLARIAKTVLLTDHGDNVLDNCAKNVQLNYGVFHCHAAIHVRELDWMNPSPPEVSTEPECRKR